LYEIEIQKAKLNEIDIILENKNMTELEDIKNIMFRILELMI